MERDYILPVFRETGWVLSTAAIRLGVPRTTLNAMMKKLGSPARIFDDSDQRASDVITRLRASWKPFFPSNPRIIPAYSTSVKWWGDIRQLTMDRTRIFILNSEIASAFVTRPCGRAKHRGRELYANIEEPKTAQTILRHPRSHHSQLFFLQSHPLIPDYLANSVGGPEKAGVGGSIPSLATTFQNCPARRHG